MVLKQARTIWFYDAVMRLEDVAGRANGVGSEKTDPLGAVLSVTVLSPQTFMSIERGK